MNRKRGRPAHSLAAAPSGVQIATLPLKFAIDWVHLVAFGLSRGRGSGTVAPCEQAADW